MSTPTPRTVVIQKIDLDTCLAGLLLGALDAELVIVRANGASQEELDDPDVLCIEAGGSGDVAHSNFDHHEEEGPLSPACAQAAQVRGVRDPGMLRLIDYVAAVDVGRFPVKCSQPAAFPTLSNLFSGLLLCTSGSEPKFREGMRLLDVILRERIDPFGPMPDRPGWQPFVQAKHKARATLAADLAAARLFKTRSGATAGIVTTSAPGALGALYELGCRYAIAVNETLDEERYRKVTIGGRDGALVNHLLLRLNEAEEGWGGPSHGTIIGSPRLGSALDVQRVVDLVTSEC